MATMVPPAVHVSRNRSVEHVSEESFEASPASACALGTVPVSRHTELSQWYIMVPSKPANRHQQVTYAHCGANSHLC